MARNPLHRRAVLQSLSTVALGLAGATRGGATDTRQQIGERDADAGSASARSFLRTGTLTPGDDTFDQFGRSVALSGDGTTALVGALATEPFQHVVESAVFLFERTPRGWTERAALAADDPADGFGSSVALSGDGTTALVGADAAEVPDSNGTGAAHVFEHTDEGWTQRTTLRAADGSTAQVFGQSVSLSADGTTAIVGDEYNRRSESLFGAAYVFERVDDGWTERAKLTAPIVSDDHFGTSVSLSADGTTALVGAEDTRDLEVGTASSFVFERTDDGWTEGVRLPSDGGLDRDAAFVDVSLSNDGTTALLGDPVYEGPREEYAGSVHVFERTNEGWTRRATLTTDVHNSLEGFGRAVSLSGDGTTAVVGTRSTDPQGESSQSAHVFERTEDGWTRRTVLTGGDGVFGRAVALSADGDTALIGATDGDQSGTVAAFERATAELTTPTPAFTVTPSTALVGEAVTVDASPSADVDGSIRLYEWDIDGDGTYDTHDRTARHTFTMAGTHEITLRVTDDDGATATRTRRVTVVPQPCAW